MNDIRLETASLIGEIQTLAVMVNEFTEFCVFTRYSGHVDGFSAQICKSRQLYMEKLVVTDIDLPTKERTRNKEKQLEKLVRIRSELRKILRKHEIDYGRLNYEIEEVRHYKLD